MVAVVDNIVIVLVVVAVVEEVVAATAAVVVSEIAVTVVGVAVVVVLEVRRGLTDRCGASLGLAGTAGTTPPTSSGDGVGARAATSLDTSATADGARAPRTPRCPPPVRWHAQTDSVLVGWLVGCLTSQQHTSVSQGRIGSAQTILRAATLRQKLQIERSSSPQSQYTDTGPTSPSADPITPGAWQGSHWSANFEVTGMTRPRKKSRHKRDSNPGSSALETDALTTRPTRRCADRQTDRQTDQLLSRWWCYRQVSGCL